jgi:putative SOS response-associated peptidase YedK
MCGRYVSPPIAEAERYFLVHRLHWREYAQSFNVAPTEQVPVVRLLDGQREGLLMRWGLVPYFTHGVPPRYSTINATIEKLETAACWRGPWSRGQRCLLPALGFYEWHMLADGTRRPYYIRCADQPVFGFAGLWDGSTRADGVQTLSCTVITQPANELMRDIHNRQQRMPAILAAEDVEAWLAGTAAEAAAALKPYRSDAMMAHPVSTRVNSPDNDDAELLLATTSD